jgi:hypothetical protein
MGMSIWSCLLGRRPVIFGDLKITGRLPNKHHQMDITIVFSML